MREIIDELNVFSLKRLKDFLHLKLTDTESAATVQFFIQ